MTRTKRPTRDKRGNVHIWNRNGCLYLRWTVQGKKYKKSLGLPDSPVNQHGAKAKAAEIERDIALGQFDTTLERYWPSVEMTDEKPDTLELWERFMDFRRKGGTSGQTISTKYKAIWSNLGSFGRDVQTEKDAEDFVEMLSTRQNTDTLKNNVDLLKGFGQWCVDQGYRDVVLFRAIRRVRGKKNKLPKPQPFTAAKIRQFLEAIKNNRYYSVYHDFCAAFFFLGIRPAEAIGLRWQDVDFDRSVVVVQSSLARNEDGRTAGYARQRKTTKNGKKREVGMAPPIKQILQDRRQPDSSPNDLIFLTARGNPIDDHSFSQRCWKKICQEIGVDAVPYTARHSLGSHLFEDGYSAAQVADILGNEVETTIRYYIHGIEKPEMPTYGIGDEDDVDEDISGDGDS